MNPAHLVTPQILNICSNNPVIVICGYTKTGKVTIAKKISSALNRPLFISDDYITEENKSDSLYRLIDGILPYYNKKIPIIVEGILCFRLLRKGIQLNNFYPDLIIKTKCNDSTIKHFYEKDNEANKIPRALSFNKGLNKIWNDYISLLHQNPSLKRPKYIELETTLPQLKYNT
jgi:hypothetical protein